MEIFSPMGMCLNAIGPIPDLLNTAMYPPNLQGFIRQLNFFLYLLSNFECNQYVGRNNTSSVDRADI